MFKAILHICVTVFTLCSYLDAYDKPPYLSEEIWNELKPDFLPENHPIKAKLDKMFAKKRSIIFSEKTLTKAKFHFFKNSWSDIFVAKHPKIRGYVLKIFPENIPADELTNFRMRIKGANVIRNLISSLHYEKLFKVPQKWLYPLPYATEEPGVYRKYFILVAEDMNLANSSANRYHWKSSKISKELLQALYRIITIGGLKDSCYVDNIPFSRDGKIAFIDTEHSQAWPIPYNVLTNYISKSNAKYWLTLPSIL